MKSAFTRVFNRLTNKKSSSSSSPKNKVQSDTSPFFDFTIYNVPEDIKQNSVLGAVRDEAILSHSKRKLRENTMPTDFSNESENIHPNKRSKPIKLKDCPSDSKLTKLLVPTLNLNSTKTLHSLKTSNTTIDDRFESSRTNTSRSITEIQPASIPLNNKEFVNFRRKSQRLSIAKYITASTTASSDIRLPHDIEDVFSKLRHNRLEVVKAILEDGAFNINSIDCNGNTMLHICAQNNHKQMASMILEYGCALNSINNKGLKPLDYCEYYQFDEMHAWLKKKGAKASK